MGRGVPADLSIAQTWYEKAAQQGHPQAAANLGLILFQNGEKQRAIPWSEDGGRGRRSARRICPRHRALQRRRRRQGLAPRLCADEPRRGAGLPARRREPAVDGPIYSGGAAPAGPRHGRSDRALGQCRRPPDPRRRPARPAHRAFAEQCADLDDACSAADGHRDPVAARPPPAEAADGRQCPSRRAAFRRRPPQCAAAGRVGARACPHGGRPLANPARRLLLAGGAHRAWDGVKGRLGGLQPIYGAAGAVTRLQAGPLPSRAAAERACAAAGSACFPVASA